MAVALAEAAVAIHAMTNHGTAHAGAVATGAAIAEGGGDAAEFVGAQLAVTVGVERGEDRLFEDEHLVLIDGAVAVAIEKIEHDGAAQRNGAGGGRRIGRSGGAGGRRGGGILSQGGKGRGAGCQRDYGDEEGPGGHEGSGS